MDYPAAHSMDSTWFAVDADGHVAVFATRAEGPLPVGAVRDHVDGELVEAYARECAQGFAEGALDDERAIDGPAGLGDLLLVLDGERPEARGVFDDPGAELVTDDPLAVRVTRWDPLGPALDALRRSPAYRASFFLPWSVDEESSARFGVYYYEHDYVGDGYAYLRKGAAPERPRVVGSLADAQVFALPRTRFARDEVVAVTDQLPCDHYDGERTTPDDVPSGPDPDAGP